MHILHRFCLVIAALCFFACTPQRKLVYLQGDPKILQDSTDFNMQLYAGDIIQVELFTVNPEAFPGIASVSVKPAMMDNRSPYEKGFVLNNEGVASIPYIGNVHLGGLTLSAAHDTIANRFAQLVDEPVVIVKKLSFKVSILGEVNHPGLYYVPNEKLTLLEALALGGDFTNFADRTKLRILRKTAKGTEEIPVDITQKIAYTGSTRFLYPDDVLYVPPTRKKAFTQISPAVAVFSSVLTTIVVIGSLYIKVK